VWRSTALVFPLPGPFRSRARKEHFHKPERPYFWRMTVRSKPFDLPPEVAAQFVRDTRAFHLHRPVSTLSGSF